MKNILPLVLIPLGIIAAIFIFLAGYYNKFVTLNQQIDGQWAQVEVQYQRRFDLIPNLVNSVKGVLTQEQKVFGDIAEARTRYSGAGSTNEKAQAASQLEGAVGRLLVVIENYPQLRSNETVQSLMDELAGTENRIAVERRRFNELVQGYNTQISVFPGRLMAGIFGFSKRDFFQAAQGAEKAPAVNL